MTTKMDSDLLDFVSGTTTVTPNTNTTTTIEPLPKKKTTTKNVSISDLTSILADKTGFSGLKKRMGHLQNSLLRAHEDGTRRLEGVDALTAASNTYDATSTTLTADLGNTRKIPILADPLQPVEAKRLQRESALELATSEANRWIPVIRGNRKSKHLHFSSTPKKERDEGMAVQNCEQLVSTTSSTSTDNSLENEIHSLLHKNEMTSMHSMLAREESEIKGASTVEAAEERYKELAKRRSLMFFEEKKRSAQKKIKSKSFRRQLKKERIKKIEKSITPMSTLTAEEREEMRLKAGMDRIRERMTLRTRKADKWAHDRLSSSSIRGSGGNSLKDGILEQLRDKARLREEIMGGADDFSSSGDDNDDVVVEEEEGDDDVPSELDRISSEGSSSSGDDDDDKGGIGEIFKNNQKREDLLPAQSVIAKRSFGSIDTVDSDDSTETAVATVRNVRPNTENTDSEDEDYNNNNKVTLSKNDEQQRLIREAFSADSNSIFHSKSWEERKEEILAEEEKERMQAADAGEGGDAFAIAASTSDLPGFGGKWSGSGISATTTATTKTTQQRGPKVLNSLKRANGSGAAHVIIHQRLPSLTKGRLLCQGAPHNYPGGSEQYESDMAGKRIGKEWNRQKSHSERIRARVTVSSGSIVDPIRFQKKNSK